MQTKALLTRQVGNPEAKSLRGPDSRAGRSSRSPTPLPLNPPPARKVGVEDASFRPSRRLLGQLRPQRLRERLPERLSASGAPIALCSRSAPSPRPARLSETLAVPTKLPNRRPGQPPLTRASRPVPTYLPQRPPGGRCSLHSCFPPPPPRTETLPRALRRGKPSGAHPPGPRPMAARTRASPANQRRSGGVGGKKAGSEMEVA